jgi:hypothetical protein
MTTAPVGSRPGSWFPRRTAKDAASNVRNKWRAIGVALAAAGGALFFLRFTNAFQPVGAWLFWLRRGVRGGFRLGSRLRVRRSPDLAMDRRRTWPLRGRNCARVSAGCHGLRYRHPQRSRSSKHERRMSRTSGSRAILSKAGAMALRRDVRIVNGESLGDGAMPIKTYASAFRTRSIGSVLRVHVDDIETFGRVVEGHPGEPTFEVPPRAVDHGPELGSVRSLDAPPAEFDVCDRRPRRGCGRRVPLAPYSPGRQ